jgi:hypothetical protein
MLSTMRARKRLQKTIQRQSSGMVELFVERDGATAGMVAEGVEESGRIMGDRRQVVVRGKRRVFPERFDSVCRHTLRPMRHPTEWEKTRMGYIYFHTIEVDGQRRYKIGRSMNAQRRLLQWQRSCPKHRHEMMGQPILVRYQCTTGQK